MEQANALTPIALFGSVAVFLALFALLPPRRALLASFLGGWLFLPVISYDLEGLPDFSKLFVTCFGILIAVIIFDFKRLTSFRPNWVDLPVLVWCLVPIASSVTNGLGLYDGLSETLGQLVQWGVPYLLGRLYFKSWSDLRELAVALVIAGVVYTPFILFELRMSPQLHRLVYGYYQHAFSQTLRFGMWRPMVFMNHGLMLAFFVMAVTLTSFWLWWSGAVRQFRLPRLARPIPFWVVPAWFTLLTAICVSVNAWLWLLIGAAVLLLTERLRTPWVLIGVMLAIPLYILTQGVNVWPGDVAVDFATGLFGSERAQSLSYRYFNEEMLTEKARQQWLFGWGGWGRQLVRQEWGPTTVPDSLWVIVFGKFGAVGLIGLVGSLLLPGLLYLRRYGAWLWGHPNLAPAAVFSTILVLYMFDGLLNAMINPIYMLLAGGLMGIYVSVPQLERRLTSAQATPPPQAATAD